MEDAPQLPRILKLCHPELVEFCHPEHVEGFYYLI